MRHRPKASHAPVDAIAALYRFTPAETQLFALLSKGVPMDKAAAGMGIARSTAKTHLLRVVAKTGCKRQVELVALAARLSLNI